MTLERALRLIGLALLATGLGVFAGVEAHNISVASDPYFHDTYFVLVDPALFLAPIGAGIAALVAARLCRATPDSDNLAS
jgi:hypothetical protein